MPEKEKRMRKKPANTETTKKIEEGRRKKEREKKGATSKEQRNWISGIAKCSIEAKKLKCQ